MKSKTFCFKKVIIGRDLRYMLGIAAVFCLFLYAKGFRALNHLMHVPEADKAKDYFWTKVAFVSGIHKESAVLWVAALSVLCAMICFHYLFDKRAVQVMHAMPVSRTQLFVVHYFDGLLTIMLPIVLNMIPVLILLKQRMFVKAVGLFYGELLIEAFLFYSMMVLLIMICGVSFLPPVLFLIFNYLFEGLWFTVNRICSSMIFGFNHLSFERKGAIIEKIYMLSPLKYMMSGMGIIEEEKGIYYAGASLTEWYVVVAVVMVVLAFLAYKRRPVESWGDFLTQPWLKVFFSLGITGCVEIIFFSLLVNAEEGRHLYSQLEQVNFLIVLLTTFCVYYVVSVIVRKTFRGVWRRKAVAIPAVILSVALSGFVFVFQGKAEKIENYIPKQSDIEFCDLEINIENGMAKKPPKVDQIMALQQAILEHKEEIRNSREETRYAFSLTYYLKDKTMVKRTYFVPLHFEKVNEKGSLEALVDETFNTFDRFDQRLFESNWKEAGLWKRIKDKKTKVRNLPVNEIKKAVLADISEGTLKPLYFAGEKGADVAENNVLDIHMDSIGNCMYYNYEFTGVYIAPQNASGMEYTNMELRINEKCRHTIAVLKKNGFPLQKLKEGDVIEANVEEMEGN